MRLYLGGEKLWRMMHLKNDCPRGQPEWIWDNPSAAAVEFAEKHPEFKIEHPVWPFNESGLR